MSGVGVKITLTCDECGSTVTVQSWYSLTKMGSYRLEGSSEGFYIDGALTLCAAHATETLLNLAPQRETWGQYDRRSVEAELDHEAHLDRIVERYPGLERRA